MKPPFTGRLQTDDLLDILEGKQGQGEHDLHEKRGFVIFGFPWEKEVQEIVKPSSTTTMQWGSPLTTLWLRTWELVQLGAKGCHANC